MKRRKKLMVILVSVFLCIPVFVFAETVILGSGERIEGKIIEKTEDYIKMEHQGASLTYSLEDIDSIDGRRVVPPSYKTDCVPTENYSIIGKWEQASQTSKGHHAIFEFLENGDFLIYDLYDIEDRLPKDKYKFIDKNHIAINYRKKDGTPATINEEIYFSRDGKAQMKGDITQAKYKFVNKSRIEIDGFYKSDNVSKKPEFEICFTKDGILKLMYLSPDGYGDSNLYYKRVLE